MIIYRHRFCLGVFMRYLFVSIFALQLVTDLHAIQSDENHHSFFPLQHGSLTQEGYFNRLRMPDVRVSSRTRPHCKEDCTYPVIENREGRVLVRYASDETLYTVAKGRYSAVAYLQYEHDYPCGDKTCSETIFIDHQGRRSPSRSTPYGFSRLISKDKKIYSITSSGIYANTRLILASKHPLTLGDIKNNPFGDIAAAGVDVQGQLISTNTQQWHRSTIHLQEHGDRKGILSVYPKNSDESYVAIYNYTRAENKGLMGVHTTYSSNSERSGWLFNARDQNVGFDPSIVVGNNTVYISATDSTNGGRVMMSIPEEQFDAITQAENYPQHIIGYEEEKQFNFLLGSRLAYNAWYASTDVTTNEIDYAEATYELDDSLYTALYFSGRIYNVRLGLSYLQNWAEKRGGGVKVASKLFNMFLDFDSLFSKSSSLRIEVERAKLNGTVDYKRNDEAGIITGPAAKNMPFQTTYTNFSAKVMLERGAFIGASYIEYNAPAAVGFSNSAKDLEYVTFDEDFNYQDYLLIVGYDELSYAKRYETDISRFYIEGNGGIGLSVYDISDSTRQEVERATAKSINSTFSMVLQAELNLGYLWQRRFNNLNGFGYAITIGLKAHGSWQGSGQSKDSDSKIDDDALELETDRLDLWYGPYISFNILF